MIFLEQPRTGSTAVRFALGSVGGIRRQRHLLLLPKQGEKVVTTIRDPYDMWVTWFLNRGPTLNIFDMHEFTEKFEPRDGELYWFAKYADYLLRYEQLQADLNAVLRKLNIRLVRLEHRNITKNKNKKLKSYFKPETLELFHTKYGAQFRKHGYTQWTTN
jgi:hypothetical protein